ncbi:unnamed protein product [Clonostachys rhizophaga]|uniref:Uncharacterized protein n=1 Tax=Clonostachys rhizophaga TaxID=160324 RepID=A0A9N9VHM9_9HYPO|nr:unnamed protein product [Clonostachys rhizophaga]
MVKAHCFLSDQRTGSRTRSGAGRSSTSGTKTPAEEKLDQSVAEEELDQTPAEEKLKPFASHGLVGLQCGSMTSIAGMFMSHILGSRVCVIMEATFT